MNTTTDDLMREIRELRTAVEALPGRMIDAVGMKLGAAFDYIVGVVLLAGIIEGISRDNLKLAAGSLIGCVLWVVIARQRERSRAAKRK